MDDFVRLTFCIFSFTRSSVRNEDSDEDPVNDHDLSSDTEDIVSDEDMSSGGEENSGGGSGQRYEGKFSN